MRKEDWKRKQTTCSKRLGKGHNRKSCREAPARRQRALGQELSISSNSSSSDLGVESEADSELQAVLNYYVARARAKETAESNQCQEIEERESDSSPELSLQASSLFDGMEGIEIENSSKVEWN